MRKGKKWQVVALAAALAIVASLLFVAGPSAASKTHVWNNSGSSVSVYSTKGPCKDSNNPSSCRVQDKLKNGTSVSMYCWADFPKSYNGNYASKRWFVIKYGSGNKTAAWVHSSYVQNQTTVKNCHDVPSPSVSEVDNGASGTDTSSAPRRLQSTAKPSKSMGSSYVHNQSGSTVKIYSDPSTSSIVYKKLKNGSDVSMICWKDAKKTSNGNYPSRRWFEVWYYLSDLTFTQASGWVHSSYVYYQTTVGKC